MTAARPGDGQKRMTYHDAQGAHRHGMTQLDYYRFACDC